MDFDHGMLVGFSKSWGLFYLIGLTIAVCVYTFRPKNRKKFTDAKNSILREDDRP